MTEILSYIDQLRGGRHRIRRLVPPPRPRRCAMTYRGHPLIVRSGIEPPAFSATATSSFRSDR